MNMELWNSLARPPKEALKAIVAGRLRGKSDINPQWRMKVLTEKFGPCGIGWKYSIEKLWTESGENGQVFAFSLVLLYTKNGEEWSAPIPGIGGSMLVVKETSGLHHNDEAFKMATTDALSVAMKAIGVAADIYLGLWDGSKYTQDLKILPNDDAGKNLTQDRKNYIADLATEIKDAYDQGDFMASAAYTRELKENEETLFLWSLLDSKIKSTIKAYEQIERAKTADELKRAWEDTPKHAQPGLLAIKDEKKALLTKEKEAA